MHILKEACVRKEDIKKAVGLIVQCQYVSLDLQPERYLQADLKQRWQRFRPTVLLRAACYW